MQNLIFLLLDTKIDSNLHCENIWWTFTNNWRYSTLIKSIIISCHGLIFMTVRTVCLTTIIFIFLFLDILGILIIPLNPISLAAANRFIYWKIFIWNNINCQIVNMSTVTRMLRHATLVPCYSISTTYTSIKAFVVVDVLCVSIPSRLLWWSELTFLWSNLISCLTFYIGNFCKFD